MFETYLYENIIHSLPAIFVNILPRNLPSENKDQNTGLGERKAGEPGVPGSSVGPLLSLSSPIGVCLWLKVDCEIPIPSALCISKEARSARNTRPGTSSHGMLLGLLEG